MRRRRPKYYWFRMAWRRSRPNWYKYCMASGARIRTIESDYHDGHRAWKVTQEKPKLSSASVSYLTTHQLIEAFKDPELNPVP